MGTTASLVLRCGPVNRRPGERVTETHVAIELDETGRGCRCGGVHRGAEPVDGAPHA